MLREVLDDRIPLSSVLKRELVKCNLLSLLEDNILNPEQFGKLYPSQPSSPIISSSFDPALLMVLVRTISNLDSPISGWDVLPHSQDTSVASYIVRLKYVMNEVGTFSKEASVSDEKFHSCKQQIENILVKLGGLKYKGFVEEIENQEIEPSDGEHYKEVLKQWKDNTDTQKDKINEWERKTKLNKLEGAVKTSGFVGEFSRVDTWLYSCFEGLIFSVKKQGTTSISTAIRWYELYEKKRFRLNPGVIISKNYWQEPTQRRF